jgi:hypothetical protein
MEARARRLAERPGRDVVRLGALFAEDTRRRGTSYRVDTSSGRLAPVEP